YQSLHTRKPKRSLVCSLRHVDCATETCPPSHAPAPAPMTQPPTRSRTSASRGFEARPLLRPGGHHHVHLLNLAAGESPFDGQVQAGEGEGGPNRRFRLRTNVL